MPSTVLPASHDADEQKCKTYSSPLMVALPLGLDARVLNGGSVITLVCLAKSNAYRIAFHLLPENRSHTKCLTLPSKLI